MLETIFEVFIPGIIKNGQMMLKIIVAAKELCSKEEVKNLIDDLINNQKVQKRRISDILNLVYDYWNNIPFLDQITFVSLFYVRAIIHQSPGTLAAILYAVNELREEDEHFNDLYNQRVLINPLVS